MRAIPRRASFLGLPREIRQQIYHYVFKDENLIVHIGLQGEELFWSRCTKPSPRYQGLCESWGSDSECYSSPGKIAQRPDPLAVMQTCEAVAQEVNAIIFAEVVICISVEDALSFREPDLFRNVTRATIHGTISDGAIIGFTSMHDLNSHAEDCFNFEAIRTRFPNIIEVSFQLHNENWTLSNRESLVLETAAGVLGVNIIQFQWLDPRNFTRYWATFEKNVSPAWEERSPVRKTTITEQVDFIRSNGRYIDRSSLEYLHLL